MDTLEASSVSTFHLLEHETPPQWICQTRSMSTHRSPGHRPQVGRTVTCLQGWQVHTHSNLKGGKQGDGMDSRESWGYSGGMT